MGFEVPMLSVVVARLADPEVHLAAYGGVVFPLALIIEAPIIMLLAASTALSRDRAAYDALRTFMFRISAVLTALHMLLAFSPLYDVAVVALMEVPPEVVEPARLGLQIMTPWTAAIAYRRFNQGALIRFGHSRAVGVGTFLRLVGVVSMLAFGFIAKDIAGVVVAATAVVCGVILEAVYIGFRVRPVVHRMAPGDPARPPLEGRVFADFYVPLAMTSLITLIVLPIGSAAVSRMPAALESLAVWPVVNGVVFLLQGFGLAYNEVVVAMLGQPRSLRPLWTFAWVLAVGTTAILVLLAATDLSPLWFRGVTGLPDDLARMAEIALWIAIPIPAARGLQSWYQGLLVFVHKTAPITESVVVFLAVCCVVLFAGMQVRTYAGVNVAMTAFAVGRIAQTVWLVLRSRSVLHDLRGMDSARSGSRPIPAPEVLVAVPSKILK